jgi:lysozyme
MNREILKETLRKAEGFSQPYWDVSQYSGGYGHKLPESYPVKERGAAETFPISIEQAEDWLDEDISIAENDTISLFSLYYEQPDVRQRGLVEFLFNLGKTRASKFVKALSAANADDWATCAAEMKDSKWASQIGNRADRIIKQVG